MDAPAREVAILIAAYNAEATLDRAVRSALDQREVAEVCIVDDCSTDATRARAEAWAERDGRVSVLRQSRNAGPAAARNAAIAATRAPWLAVLDADDYLAPGRFGEMLAHANAADFVADALIRVKEGEAPGQPAALFAPEPIDLEAFLLGDLGGGQLNLGFLKPLMRRSFLQRHGLVYNQEMRLGEDFDLYARALAHGALFLLGGPAGYVSIERAGSLSKAHGAVELRAHRDNHKDISAVRPLSAGESRALRRHWDFVDRRLQWSLFVEAAKKRDVLAALSAFRSPQAALHIARNVASQIWARGMGLAGRRRAA